MTFFGPAGPSPGRGVHLPGILKHRNLVRGKRYPLTESGLKTAFRRAVPRAGVTDFRFHDTRHTAATRTLRKSNLRVVQNLLGHSSPATTVKYAHAVDDDIKAAMNAAEDWRGKSTTTGKSSRKAAQEQS